MSSYPPPSYEVMRGTPTGKLRRKESTAGAYELDRLNAERETQMRETEKTVLQKLTQGSMSVRELVTSVSTTDLQTAFGETGDPASIARKYAVASTLALADLLDHPDARVQIASAKVLLDLSALSEADKAATRTKDVTLTGLIEASYAARPDTGSQTT